MPKRKQTPVREEEEEAASDSPVDSGSEEGPSHGGSSSSGDEASGSSTSSSSEDDEEGSGFEEVEVDFEFYDPQEADFHGVRVLLERLLDGQQWEASQLVDAIIQQSTSAGVGTVIKCGEEDDPIGVSSVLSVQHHRDLKPMQQLHAFMAEHAPDTQRRQALQQAWDAPGTGLIINERLVNSPPQLAPPLQEALFSEVEAAAEDEDLPEEQRSNFRFKRYLMLARAYADPTAAQQDQAQGAAGGSGGSKKKKRKQQQEGAGAASSGLIHVHPELECYEAQADWAFAFPVAGREDAKDELQQRRLVMLVSAAGVEAGRRRLAELLANVGGGN